ncbi:hypothetical protein ACET3Z_001861 [Daucus carota]
MQNETLGTRLQALNLQAEVIVGFSSIEVSAVAVATLSFAAIGLLDDSLSLINKHNGGLSSWTRIVLERKTYPISYEWKLSSQRLIRQIAQIVEPDLRFKSHAVLALHKAS